MSGMFGAPSTPALKPIPQAPSMTDAAVQEAADGMARTRRGRASTTLTDPSMQREAEQTNQRTLLAGN
jgi:hypothetical protein